MAPAQVLDLSTIKELVCGAEEPAAPVETSAPLSASDLQSCLERLTVRSEEVKQHVYRTISAHQTQFAGMLKHASKTSAEVEELDEDLQRVLKLLVQGKEKPDSDDGGEAAMSAIDGELGASAAELRHIRTQLEEKDLAVRVVRIVASAHMQIKKIDGYVASGEVRLAAEALVELGQALEPLGDARLAADVAVFRILQAEWTERQQSLSATLGDLAARAVVVDAKRRDVRCFPSVALKCAAAQQHVAVATEDIWAAMETLDLPGASWGHLADSLFTAMVEPILREPAVAVSVEERFVEVAQGGEDSREGARALLQSERKKKIAEVTPAAVYGKLLPLVRYLGRHVACGDRARLQRIGRVLWPQCADAIISGCLSKAIPSETAELAKFQETVDQTVNFERELVSEGLLPEPPSPSSGASPGDPEQVAPDDRAAPGTLSVFVADVDIHFAQKKRRQFLARARALLVSSDFSSSLRESVWPWGGVGETGQAAPSLSGKGEGHFFELEPLHVTQAAQALVLLAHEALQEACLSTERTASELLRAARDCLLLYRAVMPVKHASRLESIFLLSLLYHNDCVFISHAAMTMGLMYRASLPAKLREGASFVDMVPALRESGDAMWQRQLSQLMAGIIETLDVGAHGFGQTAEGGGLREAERSVRGAVHQLSRVASVARPVAAWPVYVGSMGALVEAAAKHLVGEVLGMGDLAVEETEKVRGLLLEFLQGLPPLLDPSGSPSEGAVPVPNVEALSPATKKLQRLSDLLDMSLLSIRQAWESGDLVSCGFTEDEVSSLVQAVFTNSPLREECLDVIMSSC